MMRQKAADVTALKETKTGGKFPQFLTSQFLVPSTWGLVILALGSLRYSYLFPSFTTPLYIPQNTTLLLVFSPYLY